MAEVKVYRVVGKILHPKMKTMFKKDFRAINPNHVIEKVYMEFGARHKLKRSYIQIIDIHEIRPEESNDPIIRKLAK